MNPSDESRDRRERRILRALSPAERLQRFVRLQDEANRRLRANPAGHEAYLRRNLRRRAISSSGHA